MGKKKRNKSSDPTELQAMQYHIVELVGKVRSLDRRVRNLITYTEYIAGYVDVSVDYAEHLGEIISRHSTKPTFGELDTIPGEWAPTFLEFKKKSGRKNDIEIPL